MKNRYTCKFQPSQKNENRKLADFSEACRKAKVCLLKCFISDKFAMTHAYDDWGNHFNSSSCGGSGQKLLGRCGHQRKFSFRNISLLM